MSARPLKVIVIGAGTGGLCLAHGLRRAGIGVAVYERDRTRANGLQGYRVGIDPDGSRALHAAMSPELFDTFVATCARTPERVNVFTEQLKEVLSLDGFARSGADQVGSERSVSRMTLRQVLLTGLDDAVYFDKTFTRYEQHRDGTVSAHFVDDSSATGDLLVAADGSNSHVRRQYLPHATLTDTDLIAVGGKVPLTNATRTLLTAKIIDGINMVFAPKGYFCILHVMQFPWDGRGAPRTGIGSTDAALIARWPGVQFDNTRDYIMWGFQGARRNLPPGVGEMTGAQLHTLVGKLTARWHQDLRELFALADPSTCFSLKIRTSAPIA